MAETTQGSGANRPEEGIHPAEETAGRSGSGRLSRREALRKIGIGASIATLVAFSSDDLARLTGREAQRLVSDDPHGAASALVRDLRSSGVAYAASSDLSKSVQFGWGSQFDSGVQTAVAINTGSVVVEVHKSQGSSSLWYHVGTADQATVNWGGSVQYDSGVTPRCALNNNNVVVEVHETSGFFNSMWYHVGQVSGSSINWGGSIQYDTGITPAVALNDSGVVVEVHQSQSGSGLWYHLGSVSGSSIHFGGSVQYDNGTTPSIALNNSGVVVEVHQSQSDSSLWYHVGQASGSSISWGPSIQFDNGSQPSVAVTDDGFVIEMHQATSGNALMQNVGRISGTTIAWFGSSTQYDTGITPSVACNGTLAVQTHQSQGATTLWWTTSLLINRASWMQNALPVIGNKPLKQIAFPGSHDADMYESSIPQNLAQTQDLDLLGQLSAGIRYFDLRPHWTGSELLAVHGPITAEPIQDLLNSVQTFMNQGRQELVILKFSHYDNFDSGGVAYNTLVQQIQSTLGAWLYTSLPSGKRLADVTLNQYIASKGQVLVVADDVYPLNYPSSGIWVYRDWSSSDPQNGDLRVFDQYANTTDYATMVSDQTGKFSAYTGYCQNNTSVPCDLFLLSWTLTPVTDVYDVCRPANAALGSAILGLTIPNPSGQIVNIVYVDYGEYARATDVALFKNGAA